MFTIYLYIASNLIAFPHFFLCFFFIRLFFPQFYFDHYFYFFENDQKCEMNMIRCVTSYDVVCILL